MSDDRATDLGAILAGNLRAIRESQGRNQLEFARAARISQAHLSRLETGKAWSSMRKLGEAVERAGADATHLLHQPSAPTPDLGEISTLASKADAETRRFVLHILRRMTSSR